MNEESGVSCWAKGSFKSKTKNLKENSSKIIKGRKSDNIINNKKKQITESQLVIFNKNIKKESNSKNYLHKKGSRFVSNKDIMITSSKSKVKIINDKKRIKKEIDDKEKGEKKLDDFELNELDYHEAVILDKRNFFQIYFYFIKREHRIIFSFFIFEDYNLISIKLSRFIFLFVTDMALNVFFFSDASMHKIYINYGKYDFVQQIPQIIYSTIVSQLIEVFLCFLSLTDKHIYKIKNLKGKEKNTKNINKIFRCIKIKLIAYFLFTFIFFGIYWYIIASFCGVYQNTQKAFIKDFLMSFLLSLIYPFILYLIPSSLRLCAIRNKSMKLEFIYKLSDIIPFF